MKVLGVNGAWAQPAASGTERHGLADGSAALVTDGRVACAAIEERLSRCRYSGGYQLGARACLEAERLAWWELDAVGFSTCCDTKWDSSADVLEDLSESLGRPPAGVRTRPAVVVVDHHLSHASLAFATSGFENALVAVLDGSGNRLGPRVGEGWWEAPFQRQSFYRAAWRSGRLHLEFLEADGMAPHDLGVGGAWRAVTHYLGWPSYQQAGKTMALAAFGDPTRFRNVPLVGLDGAGLLTSGLSGRHDDPIGTVAALFQRSGISLSAPPGTPWPRHPIGDAVDLAAALQRQTEDALVSRIEGLCDREGVRNVCLSGGVALNCLFTGALSRSPRGLSVYVPSAPGDTGQGLGNALWATYGDASPLAKRVPPPGRPSRLACASLGPVHQEQDWAAAVEVLGHNAGISVSERLSPARQAAAIAELLAGGALVGVRAGRSEYGPRALGQGSVLADPRSPSSHERVNTFKKREPFRPYAPSILAEHATQYFEAPSPSPFMSFSSFLRRERIPEVPAVAHVDGSARYHTVDEDGGPLRGILEAFLARTGVPVVLNTSFNRHGEPIVESPADAVRAFVETDLDALALGPFLALKRGSGIP